MPIWNIIINLALKNKTMIVMGIFIGFWVLVCVVAMWLDHLQNKADGVDDSGCAF